MLRFDAQNTSNITITYGNKKIIQTNKSIKNIKHASTPYLTINKIILNEKKVAKDLKDTPVLHDYMISC